MPRIEGKQRFVDTVRNGSADRGNRAKRCDR
jgi:hypothetical protein